MYRLLLLAAFTGLIASALSAAEDDARPLAPARLVSIEVALAEFDPSLWPASDAADGDKLLSVLRAAESQEKVYAFTQIRLSALENQQAMAQWGERVAVPAGRTLSSAASRASSAGGFPGGVSGVTNYSRENTGATVSATCRVDEGGLIVLELSVEQSRLAADTEVKLDASDPDASVLLKPVTKTLRTTVSVANGETVVIGGLVSKAGKQFRQDALLVTARIIGAKPVQAAARPTTAPARGLTATPGTAGERDSFRSAKP